MGLKALILSLVIFVSIPLAISRPFYALMLYVFFAIMRPENLTYGQIDKFKFSFVLGIVLILSSFLKKEKFLAKNSLTVLMIMFWFFCLISYIVSNPDSRQTYYFEYFTKVMLVATLMTGIVNSQEKFRIMILFIALMVGIYSTKAGVIGIIRGEKNIVGFASENNMYGIWLCVTLSFLYCSYKGEKNKRIKSLLLICIPGTFLALLVTYSRMAYLGILAIIVYFLLKQKHKIRNIIIVTVVAAIGIIYVPKGIKEEAITIKTYREIGDDSALSRIHFWKVAGKMIEKNPIFGVGFRNYERKYNDYDFLGGQYGENRALHQSWLRIMSENGVFASMVFLSIILMSFAYGREVRKRANMFEEEKKQCFYQWSYMLEGALIGAAVGGSFGDISYNDFLWYLIALVSVLFEITRPQEEDGTSRSSKAIGSYVKIVKALTLWKKKK